VAVAEPADVGAGAPVRTADTVTLEATAPAQAATSTSTYAGLVTRAIAFAIDALIIDIAALATGAVVALALSLLSISKEANAIILAIGGVAFVLWSVGYFVVFWSTTGQTPGNRIMHIRVVRAVDGESIAPRYALVRMAGLVLATLPLFAGFVPILLTDRRRGLQDWLAGTTVRRTEP
jgi:uncharacterized RDD family membrane protein YckC